MMPSSPHFTERLSAPSALRRKPTIVKPTSVDDGGRRRNLHPSSTAPVASNKTARLYYLRRLFHNVIAFLGVFYAGYFLGYQQGMMQPSRYLSTSAASYDSDGITMGSMSPILAPDKVTPTLFTQQQVDDMVQRRMELFTKLHQQTEQQQTKMKGILSATGSATKRVRRLNDNNQNKKTTNTLYTRGSNHSSSTHLLPPGTKDFVSSLSLVSRDDISSFLNLGVPLEDSVDSNNQVLILHGRDATPTKVKSSSSVSQPKAAIPILNSAEDALEHCNTVNLVLTQPRRPDQCVAIMGQYNAYHVHRYMRLEEETPLRRHRARQTNKLQVNPQLPLRPVKRGTDLEYPFFSTQTPTLQQTKQYWNSTLVSYLANLDTYLQELKPLLKQVALCQAVIVMVCNYGQVELLANFVCHAQARQLDLSGIIVFATDVETERLVKELGLKAYYHPELFRNIPKQSAARFGDSIYSNAIVSKLFCVQLVSMLGYDILFQDVDVVWYDDPLQYFQTMNVSSPESTFDIYMQHDGSHAEFYAPYSGNTGFYFVRNNARTQYFLNSLLVSGDLVVATKTHQAPFLSVMNEHASLHGLQVKILPEQQYPGGFHYHRRPDYMKSLLGVVQQTDQEGHSSDSPAIMFHMSWTKDKVDKIKFLEQMGEWYLEKTCSTGIASRTLADPNTMNQLGPAGKTQDLTSVCCSADPILACHFSDKPSKVPCRQSPKFVKHGRPFWPETDA